MKMTKKRLKGDGCRCSGAVVACLVFVLTASLSAEVLYEQDFEDVFDEFLLEELMFTPEARGNKWQLRSQGGAAQSSGLGAPTGDPAPATAKASVEGFATHPVITVSIDTQLSMRFGSGLPWTLPFSLNLISDPEDQTSVVTGFQVNYLANTFGEATQYEVQVPRGSSFVWQPAPAMEGYQESERDSSIRGWFRWTATFRLDPETSLLTSVISVSGIGQEGFEAPELIETWEFGPTRLSDDHQGKPLHFSVAGRAREGFGVTAVDNILVTSGEPGS